MGQYAVQEAAMRAALEHYGIEKVAGAMDTFKRVITAPFRSHMPMTPRPGALGAIKDTAQGFADFGRAVVFGNPVDTYHQFQNLRKDHGTAGAYGRMLKDWYWSGTPQNASFGDKAINWMNRASTAVDLGLNGYQLATGDPDQRWGDAAATAAGLVAAPITGHMGMFAGHKAHVALTDAARTLGHRLDSSAATTPSYAPPAQRRKFVSTALRGASDNLRNVDGGLAWPSSVDGGPST